MPEGSNNITLATMWVPVAAETSGIKRQLSEAGAESAVAFRNAFQSSGVFKDFGRMITAGMGPEVQFAFAALTRSQKELKGAVDETTGSMSKLNGFLTGAAVVGVAAFGAAVATSVKAAGDFQASQVRLVASAGETAQGLDVVNKGLLSLAGQVGYSAQSLSDAMYTVEKAGYRGADGVKVMTSAAQGAKSENADLREVLTGLTTTMNDFGFGADKSADVMSKMVAATGMAKTNFQGFSSALHSVEPVAAAVAQGLDAVGKQHLLADVYGSLAHITQSGTSAAQAAQNMGRAFTTLSSPTQKMREELGQLGLNAEDISTHLGARGLSGTLQLIANTIRQHMNPAQQVVIDTFMKSDQAANSAKTMFDAMPPSVQKVAQSIKDNTLSYAAFRKTRGGLSVEQANEIDQWVTLQKKITGFSSVLKNGSGDIQTFMQALTAATGNQETARVAMQLSGDSADAVNKSIAELAGTNREADGSVKGFNETQTTFNAKMDDFKASIGAARIELGTAFLPIMTQFADGLKTTGNFLANHKIVLEGLIITMGGLGTAWLGVKAAMMAKDVFEGVVGGFSKIAQVADATFGGISKKVVTANEQFGTLNTTVATTNTELAASGTAAQTGAAGVTTATAEEVAAEGRVGAAATTANTELVAAGASAAKGAAGVEAAATAEVAAEEGVATSAKTAWTSILGPVGLGIAVGTTVAPHVENWLDNNNWLNDHFRNPVRNLFGLGAIPDHAEGGPLDGPGPKGVDSKLFWGAKGEHVLTSKDVDAMGGQPGVYAFRNALHRAAGGPIGSSGGNVDSTGMQVDTIAVAQAVAQMFPGVSSIGGYRAPDGYDEHSSGEAADVMVGGDKSLGDQIAQFALSNAAQFGVEYVLWQQTQWNPNGTSSPMPNRGSPTENHMDHVHIRTAGGGFPKGGGPGPAGAGSMPAGTSSTPASAVTSGFSGGAGGYGGGGGAGGAGGVGAGGAGGGSRTVDPEKVAHAQEELTHLQNELKVMEERKSGLKANASQAEKDKLDEEIRHEHQLIDEASGRLQKAQEGGRSKDDKNSTESLSKDFGSGFFKGLLSDLGIGNVLGGKSPLDWNVTKMAEGFISPFLEAAGGGGGGGSASASGSAGGGSSPAGFGGASSGSGGGGPLGPLGSSGSNAGGAGGSGKSAMAQQIYNAVIGAGYSPQTAKYAVAASIHESGLNPDITNASGHHGLFQESSDKPSSGAQQQIDWFLGALKNAGGPAAVDADPKSAIADKVEVGGYPGSDYDQHLNEAQSLLDGSSGTGFSPPSGGGGGGFSMPASGTPHLGSGAPPGPVSSGGGDSAPMNAHESGKQPTVAPAAASTPKRPQMPAAAAQSGKGWFGGVDPKSYAPGADYKSWYANMPDSNVIPGYGQRLNSQGTYDPNNPNRVGPKMMTQAEVDAGNTARFNRDPSNSNPPAPQFKPGGSSTDDLNAFARAHPGLPKGPGSPGFVQRGLPAVPIFDAGGVLAPGINVVHNATGRPESVVPLTHSTVSSVPTGATSYSGASAVHHAPVTYDNRIVIHGNTMSDPDQMVRPMQEQMNARVYSRAQWGGVPMALGPGGG